LAPVYIFEEIGWKLDTGRKGEQAQEGKGDERGKILEEGGEGENTWQRACAAEGTK